VRVLAAPFSGTERKRRRHGDRRAQELASLLTRTIEEVLRLEL
jgi:ribonuclease PH